MSDTYVSVPKCKLRPDTEVKPHNRYIQICTGASISLKLWSCGYLFNGVVTGVLSCQYLRKA